MGHKIKDHVLWKMIDGEVVVVDPDTDDYSYLNEVGSQIWLLIDKGCSVDAIVENIVKQYGEDETIIRADVTSLIKNLLANGLLEEVK